MKSEKNIRFYGDISVFFRYLCCLLPHRVKVDIYIIYNKVNINNYY